MITHSFFAWYKAFPVQQIHCAIRIFCRFCYKALQRKDTIYLLSLSKFACKENTVTYHA